MPPLSPLSVVLRAQARPRARNVGLAFVVMGVVLLATAVWLEPAAVCSSIPWVATPISVALSALVALAGVGLIVQIPRASAVAPALALGSALPLLGGALGDVVWLSDATCVGSVLDTQAGLSVVQGGVALAVSVVASWLLYSRDELEPWAGTRGVVLSAALALAVVTVGVGTVLLGSSATGVAVIGACLAGPLPWAMCSGLTGWLRRSPAVAVVVGSGVQVVALLLTRVG